MQLHDCSVIPFRLFYPKRCSKRLATKSALSLERAVSVDFLCSICYNSDIERSYDGKNMEWFWYIIVFRGADIGTGLAELSAAMVMVPMLIVLCSFFSGVIGACQATVIALTPDIPSVRGRRTAHEAASL